MQTIIHNVYEVYSEAHNMTFIMEDVYDEALDYRISTEVKGFYYGEPNNEATKSFKGQLKAEF